MGRLNSSSQGKVRQVHAQFSDTFVICLYFHLLYFIGEEES